MELLDLAVFLLPFPILLWLVPRVLRAYGVTSPALLRSYQVTLLIYAGLVLVAGLIGAGTLTALAGIYQFLILVLVGHEAFTAHGRGSRERRLLAATIGLALLPLLIPTFVTVTSATVALMWIVNLLGVSLLSAAWLFRTALSDLNKGRVVASAAHVAAVTLVGLSFLALPALTHWL